MDGPRSGSSYEPAWWERRFPWLLDVLSAMDPEPLGRRLAQITRPVGDLVGMVCVPLAAGLDRVAWGSRLVARHSADLVERGLKALPLPISLQSWLALRPPSLVGSETAQDVWRRRHAIVLPLGLGLATAVHVAMFSLSPTWLVSPVEVGTRELVALEVPPDIRIPPPPQRIERPAVPVIATTDVALDVTIAPMDFNAPVPGRLPPPAPPSETEEARQPAVTPFTVAPRLLNAAEIRGLMVLEYPEVLRDSGVGGDIVMWFYLSEEGATLEVRIAKGSGYETLDAAALRVAERMRFTPALNRDQPIRAWVQFPIVFRIR